MKYEIRENLLKDFLTVLSFDKYFKAEGYDIKISFEETTKFSTKIKRPSNDKREIIIKYPQYNKDKEFYNMLEDYLVDEYSFDLFLYAYQNNLSLIEVYTIFSICHEFGHVIEYINRINNGGDYLNRDEMIELSKYWEVSKIENLKERFYEYRKIDKELLADTKAISLMKQYKKEFQIIMKNSN